MKNLLKTGLLAAILFTASATYASEGVLALHVKSEDNKSIRFFIDEASDLNVSIRETNNEVVFAENIHSNGASTKTYDLNALPNGEYTLAVQSDSKLAEYKIVIDKNKAVVSDPKFTEFLKPVLSFDKSVVTLNVDNTGKGPIEVQLFNEYDEELYKETFTDKTKIVKKFNTLKTFGKELTFVVKSNDQEVTKRINIR